MTDFTVGDKVEVSYTGVVTVVTSYAIDISVDFSTSAGPTIFKDCMKENGGHLNVTVTEKAVETFGPGSVVRHRASGNVYTILESGYFIHGTTRAGRLGLAFTSDFFERLA